MSEKKIKKFYWRKLDNQAKVFALASNNKYSSVFRLSVVLKEKIEENILNDALNFMLKKYKVFKVKMKRGLFWYYFEENEKEPIVSLEHEYPFKKVNTKENNNYLFKVTYFENKINIEFFHALTDGNSGMEFFKDVIYKYLQLKYKKEFENIESKEIKIVEDSEDAYLKNCITNEKKSDKTKISYRIKGEKLPQGKVGINHFNINLDEIKKCTKDNECTLSIYLISMIAYAMYETNYKKNKGKKPLNFSIPINLKKYFETETLSNFFSYIIVTINLNQNKVYSFDDILNIVKKEFEQKLVTKKIIATVASDAGKINNMFIRIIPLFLKKIAINLGSFIVKRHFTMSISNTGKIQIDKEYEKYIEKFFVILSPDWAEKIKCGICSYQNNLVVTFASNLNDNSFETKFKDLLIEKNIEFKIEGNQINAISY